MTVVETISNRRDHFETRTFSRALWHFFKRYSKLQWEKQYMIWLYQGGMKKVARNLELLKIRTVNVPLFDVLTCRENFERSKAKWYILTLFETYVRRLLGGGCAPSLDPLVKSVYTIYNLNTYYKQLLTGLFQCCKKWSFNKVLIVLLKILGSFI